MSALELHDCVNAHLGLFLSALLCYVVFVVQGTGIAWARSLIRLTKEATTKVWT